MKKIVLFNPSISSMNIGDEIISNSAKNQMDFLLNSNFCVDVSTHLPTSLYYMRYLTDADYSLVLGSNLLKSTFFGFKRQWDITLKSTIYLPKSTLIGAGWWQYNNKPNLYTKMLLKKILNKDMVHSVRDEYTKETLKSIGINNVINTSCATMWGLTQTHTDQIPSFKSDSVVFTITDYNKDYNKDKLFIETLINNYDRVYFWPQGIGDLTYFNNLNIDKKYLVNILNPNLESFDRLLDDESIDYIGTRLHGGIRALQKKRRTMIIGIDNRAIEKKKSFNLKVLNRDDIEELSRSFINSKCKMDIIIPNKNIELFKNQF